MIRYIKLSKHRHLDMILNKDKTKVLLKLTHRYEIREVPKHDEGALLFWTRDRKLAYQKWREIKDRPMKVLKLPYIEW